MMNTLREKASKKKKYCTVYVHLYEINLCNVMTLILDGMGIYQGFQLIRTFQSLSEYNFNTANTIFFNLNHVVFLLWKFIYSGIL